MIPRWAVAQRPDPGLVAALAAELGVPEPLAAILVQRGFAAPDIAKAFLRPDLERLSDPCGWADMRSAVDLLAGAVRSGRPILVHGDYDVPGDELPPASAVLDPRRPDCPNEDNDLCGTGVAFKLAQALMPALGRSSNVPLHFLDYVALATVADVVPLTGENRILVRHGLKMLADSRWTGLRALVDAAGLAGRPIKAGHVGFILAPRLNAAGRIGEPAEGLRLLLAD